MKLSWIGMTATAIAVGAGPVYAAGDTRDASTGKGKSTVAKRAAAFKASAWAALGKGDAVRAVQDAETATMLLPNDAGMRSLLGRAYLAAGRFGSAETAFSDALTLDPGLPRAAVSRALAQIALGNSDAARASLASAEGIAADADIGLAQALLGDAEVARQRLDAAARAPGADVRTRQNLGLAYALEGRWSDAVAVAEQDVPADLMPQRLHRWAMIAQMKSDPAMQVGAVLGVLPAEDSGQPLALALAPQRVAPAIVAPVALAAAATPAEHPIITKVVPEVQIDRGAVVTAIFLDPPPLNLLVAKADIPPMVLPDLDIVAPEPVIFAQLTAAAEQPAPIGSPVNDVTKPQAWAGPPRMRSAASRKTPVWGSAPKVVAERVEVSRPRPVVITAAMTARAPKPVIVPASLLSLKPVPAKAMGGWAVQVGAFSSSERREIAWGRLIAKASFLSAYTPTGSGYEMGSTTLHRLAVSGLGTRMEAVNLCVRIKAAGGQCFVRSTRGDEPMQWALRSGAGDRA